MIFSEKISDCSRQRKYISAHLLEL